MDEKMVVREWYDEDNNEVYYIRFVKVNDMWYAVLKDICFALGLKTFHVSQRIDSEYLLNKSIPVSDIVSTDTRHQGQCINRIVTLVNENGIYQCISGSRKLTARKFNKWYPRIIAKLRAGVGLPGFMAMEMMNEKVQNHINEQLDKFIPEFDPFLDSIYFDEETGILMQSVTLPGGDVTQVPYEGEAPFPYNMYSFK